MENKNEFNSVLTKHQVQTVTKHNINYEGELCDLVIKLRYDDECGNGHNSFAITGDIYKAGRRGDHNYYAGGCVHDEIKKHAPELAKYIKWHLVSSDEPMHYVNNTLYLAGDRDCWGYKKGEVKTTQDVLYFNSCPIPLRDLTTKYDDTKLYSQVTEAVKAKNADFFKNIIDMEIIGVDHEEPKTYGTKYYLGGFDCGQTWYKCQFDTQQQAAEFIELCKVWEQLEVKTIATSWGEGKDRELEAARRTCLIEDITDEQLCLPREELKALLMAELPKVRREFKSAMLELGFTY